MSFHRFFALSALAAAVCMVSSCFIIRPIQVAVESPDVLDDSVPKEDLAYIHFDTGFIPVSYNEIPIDELSRYSKDDRSIVGSPTTYHYLAIPSGRTRFIGNISFSRQEGFFEGRRVYTAAGATFDFNFKPGVDYIIELVFEDKSLGVDIFEGTKGYYYDSKTFLERILF
ncbi:MAG: hypothetical protein LBK13_05725 [Spirochaetales bacterium]|jgi:hypothetical protein|nr:hypothetical protein [Spirochaetales bacterium]